MVMRKKNKKHAAKKASSAVELSSSVWQSHVEPQTGMTYYHNTTTGETSWRKLTRIALLCDLIQIILGR